MYWQVNLAPTTVDRPRWLPANRLPAPEQRHAQPDASPDHARSVPPRAPFSPTDLLYVGMTEAILRLVFLYPGLAAGIAGSVSLQPGESREAHFRRMMTAISDRAPDHPGLGLAIDAALEPFSREDLWRS